MRCELGIDEFFIPSSRLFLGVDILGQADNQLEILVVEPLVDSLQALTELNAN